MTDVVFLKVKIGLKPNGHADYPQWTELPLAGTGSQDEREGRVSSHQIVKWHYDKTSGHDDDTPDSPRGQQWGILGVTEQFATEAIAMWPDRVSRLNSQQAKSFWETKAMAHLPAMRHDVDVLQALKAERDLRLDRNMPTDGVDAAIDAALDPDNPSPGLRRTPDKDFNALTQRLKIRVR